MTLRIKKQPKNWAYLQIIFVMFCGFLTSQLGLPTSITYFTDVVTVILFFSCIFECRSKRVLFSWKVPIVIIVLLFVSSLVGFIYNLNSASLFHYIWGFRNMGRTFVFMFCCVKMFDLNDIYSIMNLFDKLFWVNIVYCSFQFWVQGLWCDTVGGIFGTNYGCLSYINIQLCMVLIYHVSKYLNGRESFMKTGLVAICSFYLATITELKVFFVEFVIIFLFLVLSNKPSLKSFALLFGGFFALFMGLQLISAVLPDAAQVLSVDGLLENLTAEKGYTHSGDLSRFSALSTLKEKFFSENLFQECFGFGLGNCETSSISMFNTEFYHTYEYLNYRWFTHAMLYLELGRVGLILFYAFLVSCILYSFKIKRRVEDKVLWSCSLGFPLIVIICSIYNSSFRTEAGYLSAFMLSCVFILAKCINKTEEEKWSR